jgi:hypothetical protein
MMNVFNKTPKPPVFSEDFREFSKADIFWRLAAKAHSLAGFGQAAFF